MLGFTVISNVLVSPQVPEISYVIVCVPAPAVKGSKVPKPGSVIPFPLHRPPGSTAVKFKIGSSSQNGPTGVIVASC